MIYLKEWSVGNTVESPFAAPELGCYVLQGFAYGHPNFPDGVSVTTSEIKEVHGKLVTTSSGSVYFLDGWPCAGYLQFLRENKIKFNENEPLKFKK